MFDADAIKHLHIEFYTTAVENKRLSQEQNRPIFDNKEMVRIKFVGDPKKELDAPAHEKFTRGPDGQWISYAQAYHKHYDAFKAGEQQRGSGTPLSELPFLTEARRAELKALNIHTAEALADLGDANIGRLGMFGRADRDKARAYIEKAKDGAADARLAAENAELRQRLEALEAMMRTQTQATAPAVAEPSGSIFASWDDVALKSFIKERTGSAPKGQPSHETLMRMAEEANQKEAA